MGMVSSQMLCILSAPPSRCPTSHRSNRAEMRWTDALLAMLFAPCSSITTLCASAGSWHGKAWSSLPFASPFSIPAFCIELSGPSTGLQLQDNQDMHWVQPTYSLSMTTRLYSLNSPVQPRAEQSLPQVNLQALVQIYLLIFHIASSVSFLLMSNHS